MPFVVFHTLRAEINSAAGLKSDAGEERERKRGEDCVMEKEGSGGSGPQSPICITSEFYLMA